MVIDAAAIETGSGGYDRTIDVRSGATLRVNTAGPWKLEPSGVLNIEGGSLYGASFENEGLIIGHGHLPAGDLSNDGTIKADGGTLVIHTGSFPRLAGSSGSGSVDATTGSITLPGPLTGQYGFTGQLFVTDGNEFRMEHGEFQNDGFMHLSAGTVVAQRFTQNATMEVGSGESMLIGESRFAPGSDILIGDVLWSRQRWRSIRKQPSMGAAASS